VRISIQSPKGKKLYWEEHSRKGKRPRGKDHLEREGFNAGGGGREKKVKILNYLQGQKGGVAIHISTTIKIRVHISKKTEGGNRISAKEKQQQREAFRYIPGTIFPMGETGGGEK